ncbi:MAG: pyridoxamine 5'-phosphate oxidase family protein [Gemmatimonadaceae bacterium]
MANHRDKAHLLDVMRRYRYAILATVGSTHTPQAAIVGVAVTDALETVFDTLSQTRKAVNLVGNPRIALVFGGWDESDPRTVQYEGVADVPEGPDREQVQQMYFGVFPDGPSRLSWPGITYVRVRPRWLRYSDYTVDPPVIIEGPPDIWQ